MPLTDALPARRDHHAPFHHHARLGPSAFRGPQAQNPDGQARKTILSLLSAEATLQLNPSTWIDHSGGTLSVASTLHPPLGPSLILSANLTVHARSNVRKGGENGVFYPATRVKEQCRKCKLPVEL